MGTDETAPCRCRRRRNRTPRRRCTNRTSSSTRTATTIWNCTRTSRSTGRGRRSRSAAPCRPASADRRIRARSPAPARQEVEHLPGRARPEASAPATVPCLIHCRLEVIKRERLQVQPLRVRRERPAAVSLHLLGGERSGGDARDVPDQHLLLREPVRLTDLHAVADQAAHQQLAVQRAPVVPLQINRRSASRPHGKAAGPFRVQFGRAAARRRARLRPAAASGRSATRRPGRRGGPPSLDSE